VCPSPKTLPQLSAVQASARRFSPSDLAYHAPNFHPELKSWLRPCYKRLWCTHSWIAS